MFRSAHLNGLVSMGSIRCDGCNQCSRSPEVGVPIAVDVRRLSEPDGAVSRPSATRARKQRRVSRVETGILLGNLVILFWDQEGIFRNSKLGFRISHPLVLITM